MRELGDFEEGPFGGRVFPEEGKVGKDRCSDILVLRCERAEGSACWTEDPNVRG